MTVILDKWQKEFLAHRGDRLLCTGRRVGKTYIMARGAIDRMLEKKTTIIIFSLTEEQSMLILAMAKEYLLSVNPSIMKKKTTDTNKKTITLKNGSVMKCRPAGDTGDSGRGFEADIVIVDEASRMSKFFWIAVRPIILMKAGEVWMASTPFGKQGYFWDCFNESVNLKLPESRFKVFYITTEQVIKEREITDQWTVERREKILSILEADKRSMSKLEYGQEYEGLFMEDLMQFFPDELIRRSCTIKRVPKNPEGKYYLGVDIARYGNDDITFEIIEKRNKSYFHRENIVMKKKYLNETYNKIIELDREWNFRYIYVDSGGVGVGVTDFLLSTDGIKHKVIEINNRSRSITPDDKNRVRLLKEDLYNNMLGLMERGEIHLLQEENVILSLKSMQYEYLVHEGRRTTLRIFGRDGNDHIAEGLIRAAWCNHDKRLNMFAF